MATTNQERIGKALDLLKEGLRSFVEREMKAQRGDDWKSQVKDFLNDTRLGASKGDALQDIAVLLVIMDRNWGEVFRRILGKAERSLVNELLTIRNRWAHQEPFSGDDAYRARPRSGREPTRPGLHREVSRRSATSEARHDDAARAGKSQ